MTQTSVLTIRKRREVNSDIQVHSIPGALHMSLWDLFSTVYDGRPQQGGAERSSRDPRLLLIERLLTMRPCLSQSLIYRGWTLGTRITHSETAEYAEGTGTWPTVHQTWRSVRISPFRMLISKGPVSLSSL